MSSLKTDARRAERDSRLLKVLEEVEELLK
jgi:hypothetical protein